MQNFSVFQCFLMSRDREINLSMSLEEMKNLVWCGTSGKLLNKIPPFQHSEIQLNLIPLDIGLQVS